MLLDGAQLSEIRGIEHGIEVHVVQQAPPPPQRDRQLQPLIQSPLVRQLSSAAVRRFNNCSIFYRNFQACVEASIGNIHPSQRLRHNVPREITPSNVHAANLGHHIRELAQNRV